MQFPSVQTVIVRSLLSTLLLLLIPIIAMQFSDSVDWDAADFSIAGVLLLSTNLAYGLLTRTEDRRNRRIAIGMIIAVVLFLVWAELAVGLFGTPFAGN